MKAKLHGNHEKVSRQYYKSLNSFKKIKSEVKQLKNFLEKLEQSLDIRQLCFNKFRSSLSVRVKTFFNLFTNKREPFMTLSVSHVQQTLTMSVQPSQTNGEGTTDMRALSGGERSFATVGFILALWNVTESPIRCLDEFDVFMDMVNRTVSMKMILNVAQQQPRRQFIFLTPLDTSIVDGMKNTCIFYMPDPVREDQQDNNNK